VVIKDRRSAVYIMFDHGNESRSTQLTRQIGEHLVAAELGRMGFITGRFTEITGQ
jgi:hypothetical protein